MIPPIAYIPPVPPIAAMSPYVLARLHAPQGTRLISLAQNESLRPPSPRATKAATKALESGQLYPDADWRDLRAALSEHHAIPAAGILCGTGSMELIDALTHAYADPRNAVLAPAHAYPFFRTATERAHARFDTAPEDDAQVCVDALLAALRPDTRLVFVANPGNPTGTRLPRAELLRLRRALPEDVLLVIDEAYGEFADHLDPPLFDLVERGDTVILRTFSKAYGLAGLRVGWGLFPPNIAVEVRKVMNPNNITLAGQAAATAALQDQTYMRETCDLTIQLREGLRARLQGAGLTVPPSFTNFVLIRMDSAAQAQRADEALRAKGVFLRPQTGAGLPDALRVTIGAPADLDRAATHLEDWLKKDTP